MRSLHFFPASGPALHRPFAEMTVARILYPIPGSIAVITPSGASMRVSAEAKPVPPRNLHWKALDFEKHIIYLKDMSTNQDSGGSRSRTRYLILGLLGEGPMSGYDISQLTKLRFRFFWSESYGQIYPELARLAAEGLIDEAAGGGSRGKRVWKSTRAGKAALAAWLKNGESVDSVRLETVLKAYFAFAAPGAFGKNLARFSGSLERDIAALEEAEAQLRSIPDPHHNHAYALATVDFGLATYRAWKKWAGRWAEEDL